MGILLLQGRNSDTVDSCCIVIPQDDSMVLRL